MSENKDILKFVETLGVVLLPWQKEVLTMLSELPEGQSVIYIPGRASGKTNFEKLLRTLKEHGYAVPDIERDYTVIRKSDLGSNQLGFRSTASFIDEDILRKGDRTYEHNKQTY